MIDLNILEQIVLITAVGMGIFPHATAAGIESCLNKGQVIKVAAVFSLFKAGLFALSFWVGRIIHAFIPESAFWIVLSIFLVLGLKMIFEAIKSEYLRRSYDVQSTKILILLAVALNMNDFIGGLAFGSTPENFTGLLIIVLFTGLIFSYAGLIYGRSRGNLLRTVFAPLAGGLVLIAYTLFLFLQKAGGFI